MGGVLADGRSDDPLRSVEVPPATPLRPGWRPGVHRDPLESVIDACPKPSDVSAVYVNRDREFVPGTSHTVDVLVRRDQNAHSTCVRQA